MAVICALFLVAMIWAAALPACAQLPQTPQREAAWKPPAAQDVKTQAMAWLDGRKVDAATQAKAEAIWTGIAPQASEDEVLVRLVETFAIANANAAKLLMTCSQPRSELIVPGESWLADRNLPPLLTNNLRLFYARWLVHELLFDEAQEQLAGLEPGDVAAPAALLFYQSVVCHALLNRESGMKSIDELLQGEQTSPRRYVALARLMLEDLKGLQDDTLDHIARRMEDIRRRLDLGRAGPKVRTEEDGVVESLDKMIKKLEDQQEDESGSANSIRSTSPAKESQIMGGKGPGDVEKKNIGAGSGWGDLPPKEREAALQDVGRDLPSHYRDVIEQYFRRLAEEGSEK
jgi:hypothetical protein